MTKLARLIATQEGFFRVGTLPNRDHNPGDLRHSPHSEHDPSAPNAIGRIDTDEDGWADLERQLRLYAERGLNLGQAIYEFAPTTENDSAGYLSFVVNGFGGAVGADTPLSQVLEIEA